MTDIGAFEAKTQFSRLLQRAKEGEAFTITHRGVPIARLVPTEESPNVAQARAALRRLRERAKQGLDPAVTVDEIREWRDAGRR